MSRERIHQEVNVGETAGSTQQLLDSSGKFLVAASVGTGFAVISLFLGDERYLALAGTNVALAEGLRQGIKFIVVAHKTAKTRSE